METMSKINESAISIAEFLDERKTENTVALDISKISSWSDFFIISTVSSTAQLKGILRQMKGFLSDLGYQPSHREKSIKDENWVLLDCGPIIIHLMSKEAREFYELEKLWFEGEQIYSSKSS
jgi:ribosome-associated protein